MAPFRHVLVPVDLTASSDIAVAEALALASLSGARVTVLHVAPARLDAAARRELLFRLSVLVSAHAGEAVPPIRTELRDGDAAREVLAFAAAHEVDAIVVGTRTPGPVVRVLAESVGDRIVQGARCSVLATASPADRPAAPVRLSDILCAVDFSETSAETFEIASALARASGARLLLQHVIDPWRERERLPTSPNDLEVAQKTFAAAATQRLTALAARSRHPEVKADTLVSFGVVPNQIAGAASLIRADLVVLGAHSTRGFGRRPIGSTAREVLRLARRAVLLAQGGSRAAAGLRTDQQLVTLR